MSYNSAHDAQRQSDVYRIQGLFRREGEYWTISDGQVVIRLRDCLGLRYLSNLLRHPGRDFLALDLVADCNSRCWIRGDGGRVLDVKARVSLRARLQDLREEREEAEALNDLGRLTRILDEIEFLEKELARDTGLDGQARRVNGELDKARVNVTRTIRHAIARVARNAPRLGSYLDAAVKTGCYCSYAPVPFVFATWEF